MDSKKGQQIKFMTNNVWRREDVVLYKRMKAISDLVQKHKPDVVFFQEVTPDICDIFESSAAWWKEYDRTSVPEDQLLLLSKFPLANFERRKIVTTAWREQGYLIADMYPSPAATIMPSMRFRDRYMQAEHIVADLNEHRNAVFDGDMSWCDDSDRLFPLPAGCVDAWTALQGQDSYRGWTYDSVWEVDATRFNSYIAKHNGMRKRSDRFVCELKDYKLSRIELIGD